MSEEVKVEVCVAFCSCEGHSLFEGLPLQREGRIFQTEALVCFMNDVEYDTIRVTHFVRKARLKKVSRAATITSQQTPAPVNPPRHAHHLFIHLVHSLVCVYRTGFR